MTLRQGSLQQEFVSSGLHSIESEVGEFLLYQNIIRLECRNRENGNALIR